MRFATAFAVVALALSPQMAVAVDARERGFIREGMGEGEVLYRIGKPDHEAFIRNVRGQPEEKAWTYFPHSRDPQTMTVLTFKSGIVAKVERKIVR